MDILIASLIVLNVLLAMLSLLLVGAGLDLLFGWGYLGRGLVVTLYGSTLAVLLIVIGASTFLLAAVGGCGAARRHQLLLLLYFSHGHSLGIPGTRYLRTRA